MCAQTTSMLISLCLHMEFLGVETQDQRVCTPNFQQLMLDGFS